MSAPDNGLVLYRFFDADGELLYVGISVNVWQRFSQHRRAGSEFIPAAAAMTMQRGFVSRDELLAAEGAAIRAENPRYNVIHNRMAARLARGSAKAEAEAESFEAAFGGVSDAIVALREFAESSPEDLRELTVIAERMRRRV